MGDRPSSSSRMSPRTGSARTTGPTAHRGDHRHHQRQPGLRCQRDGGPIRLFPGHAAALPGDWLLRGTDLRGDCRSLTAGMLDVMETPVHERWQIEEYLRSQSGDDFEIEHVEKLTSEYVLGHQYDVWDARTSDADSGTPAASPSASCSSPSRMTRDGSTCSRCSAALTTGTGPAPSAGFTRTASSLTTRTAPAAQPSHTAHATAGKSPPESPQQHRDPEPPSVGFPAGKRRRCFPPRRSPRSATHGGVRFWEQNGSASLLPGAVNDGQLLRSISLTCADMLEQRPCSFACLVHAKEVAASSSRVALRPVRSDGSMPLPRKGHAWLYVGGSRWDKAMGPSASRLW